MIDKEQADHVELLTDSTGKVWVNVDGVCLLRVGKVATLQLKFDPDQYISHTQGRVIIARRHTIEDCWCGKIHKVGQ